LETRSAQTFLKDLAPAKVAVSRGSAGGWYAQVSGLGWFVLRDGQPMPIEGKPDVVPWVHLGGVCNDDTFAACDLPWDIDLGRAIPMTASADEATAEIAWRPKGDRRPSPPTNL
jgi:hypothetical protein